MYENDKRNVSSGRRSPCLPAESFQADGAAKKDKKKKTMSLQITEFAALNGRLVMFVIGYTHMYLIGNATPS